MSQPSTSPAKRTLQIRWPLAAGGYLFAFGVVTAFVLDELLGILADVIGLPADFALLLFATPAFVFGAGVWWVLVERRNSYSYLTAGLGGATTAVLTGGFWTARFVTVWGFEMFAASPVRYLVGFVFVIIAVVGTLTGPPLMYFRRQYLSPTLGSP